VEASRGMRYTAMLVSHLPPFCGVNQSNTHTDDLKPVVRSFVIAGRGPAYSGPQR